MVDPREEYGDEVENDGPAGDYLADYWFNYGGPDEPADYYGEEE